ncbi:MAG TPA: CHRD domain-containing protein [Phycisphaerales bacterium]|nr:CHRD domain-containing protein [Phycisphaerales bacterium]
MSRSLNRTTLVAAAVAVAGLSAAAGAQTFVWSLVLSGPAENPPNASPGVGVATLTLDTTAHTLRVETSFSGLLGTTTMAHIHASSSMVPFTGTAGVASQTPSFSGFPTGVTAGSYDMTFNLSLPGSWNAAYIAANGGNTASAEAALLSQMMSGRAYLNIHTTAFTGGEIRGLTPTPGAGAVLALGGLAALRRRR